MDLPPLHPILVNFTAALIPASVLSDWLGKFLRRDSFHAAGWWMLLYAAVITPFTALAGWWWMRSMQDMNPWQMSWHMWLGISLAVVTIGLAIWRGWFYRKERKPNVVYMFLATLAVVALVIQGDLGGQMSFGTGGDVAQAEPRHEHGGSSGIEWRDYIELKD